MKKLLNRLSVSGKLEVDSFEGGDDERLNTNFRKSTNLPVDAKDTSENIKVKKSMKMALSPRSASMNHEEGDFSKKKSSTSGIKKDKDKEKLNESSDKALKKSGSLRNKSTEPKNSDSMRSPALKSIFVSEYELADGSDDDSVDDEVPRSHGDSIHDDEDFKTITPVKAPYASPSPRMLTPPSTNFARAASPSTPLSPYTTSSPLTTSASTNFARASSPVTPSMMRSASSPAPNAQQTAPRVMVTDDFDLRFGNGHARTNSNTEDDVKTALNISRETHNGSSRLEDDEDEIMEEDMMIGEKGKSSGLFSRKARKSKS